MSVFAWLVIGHLIGDWMFQTDWMARSKRGRWWSIECLVHCLVYTAAVILSAWFGSGGTIPLPRVALLFLAIFISHWLIDGFDLAYWWGRLIQQTKTGYVRIVVDQTLHLIVLGIAASLFL